MLAPIGLSTYCRLHHLRQAISALRKNRLAEKSELYIFSDYPKNGDQEKVEKLRKYLRTIDGFKSVHIVERTENDRVANARGGMRMLLEKYGRTIFLEEDILTSPGFLTYMNEALEKYRGNDRIFSISGYCPPIRFPSDYRHDVFMMRRFNGWGVGIWKKQFDSVRKISPSEFDQFSASKKLVDKFKKGGGKDMLTMLKADAYGQIDAFDVKAMYAQFLNDQYTVYPVKSLTSNIGMDGTGVHCVETDRFIVPMSEKASFVLPDNLVFDKRIVSDNYRFRANREYMKRIAGKLRRLFKK